VGQIWVEIPSSAGSLLRGNQQAGTTAGAFLGEHWVIAALGLTGLFLLSLSRALRAFRERE
jgi:hypothetical protein